MKVITFTGGIGAQLISASCYFYLKHIGELVGAYLGYYNSTPHMAIPGQQGDMSHWSWDLDCYNLPKSSFSPSINEEISEAMLRYYSGIDMSNYIWDGPEKLRLSYLGFKVPSIVEMFPIEQRVVDYRNSILGSESYACLHIRRGDYLNNGPITTVDDNSLYRAARKVIKLVKKLLIVSDTPLSPEMAALITSLPINSLVIAGGEPSVLHGLMRLSDILICSNSQFSLTAALLRDKYALTIYPSRHNADPTSYPNLFLDSIREFQILTDL